MELDNSGFFKALEKERCDKDAIRIIEKHNKEEEMNWQNYVEDAIDKSKQSSNKKQEEKVLKLTDVNAVDTTTVAKEHLKMQYKQTLLKNEGFMTGIITRYDASKIGDIINGIVDKLV